MDQPVLEECRLAPPRRAPPVDLHVDRVVERIRAVERSSKLTLALDVGAIVVDEIFAGNFAMLRSQGRKHIGFRRLAAHPRIPFPRTTLWRYVRVYDLVRRMPGIVRHDIITVAHLAAVLSVPDDQQERLLRRAIDGRWSAATLGREAGNRAPKPSKAPLMRIVKRLEALPPSIQSLGRVRDLSPTQRVKLSRAVEETAAWCEAVSAWLRGAGEN